MKTPNNRQAKPQTRQEPPPDAIAEPVEGLKPQSVPKCPYCGVKASIVLGNRNTTRYRDCKGCGRRFATIEMVRRDENGQPT